ncbi:WD-40 repeat-containing protein MSI1-like isoform X2 [Asparagus officinalis]|uniref:WD-40 repeat-containing protein MSI1-like isoform X2 n=1 Tax=Asparagus officinalis TaxID=4686 RepID=UPI00098E3370|nr:WD-40 repeat-containing protein MSI1-like isoform X2 [Asparagus officinalis]
MAVDGKESKAEAEYRRIQNEYKIWRRNAPFLYDLVITHAMEGPSLTVQWLPELEEIAGKDYSVQNIIVGTNTDDGNPDYLTIARVLLPIDGAGYDRGEVGAFAGDCNKVQIIQQINHDGEVNRARYMPQNPFLIATKTVSAEVYIFDYSKHPSKPPIDGACNPDLRLKGHGSGGYGLSWSPFKKGHLLSCSDHGQTCLWDINATPENKALSALRIFKADEGIVEDVDWHLRNDYLFGSVGYDGHLHIWDLRETTSNQPIQSVVAHQGLVNCLAFNPFNEWIAATGSADKTVKLFDLRRLSTSLHTFDYHKQQVIQLGWSPKHETILASCCAGRRILVWDLNRIGEEQTQEDAEDGPPELLFLHGGHTSRISDFSWNPCDDWVIAGVADDNILQIWQMTENIYNEPDELPKPS